MEDEQQDNRKFVITKNFLNALDFLQDVGRVHTLYEFEEMTGIRQQRISGMRGYMNSLEKGIDSTDKKRKGYFTGVEHIAIMNEVFGVSLRYLLFGEKPILESDIEEMKQAQNMPSGEHIFGSEVLERIKLMDEKHNLLRQKTEFLEEKLEFLLKKQST